MRTYSQLLVDAFGSDLDSSSGDEAPINDVIFDDDNEIQNQMEVDEVLLLDDNGEPICLDYNEDFEGDTVPRNPLIDDEAEVTDDDEDLSDLEEDDEDLESIVGDTNDSNK